MAGSSIWGLLKESLTSSKLIREAIADMIADHDNDPTSHLGETGSLQSHKASEIIDHEALSIIADKIDSGQISGVHFDTSKILIKPAFESIDAYFKSLAGAGALLEPSGAGAVSFGIQSGVTSRIALSCACDNNTSSKNLNPCLEALIEDGNGGCDIYFGFGSTNFDNASQGGCFFRWNQATGNLYGHVRYNEGSSPYTPHDYEQLLGNNSQYSNSRWRIEIDYANLAIKFYVDGVLKWTHTILGTWNLYDGTYFSIVFISNTAKLEGDLQIAQLQYYQDIQP